MDEELIVGSGLSAPTNSVTVAIWMETAAHDVLHDPEQFEVGQLIPRYTGERVQVGQKAIECLSDGTGHNAVVQNCSNTSLCMRKI